ncbi:MAG: hypothetical protein ACI93R_001271 [Flavobacteriales bacterium]|jgi:hypothetical protein
MLWAIVFLCFGVPLYVFVKQTRAESSRREKRLTDIQEKLQKKQLKKISDKKDLIKAKSKK